MTAVSSSTTAPSKAPSVYYPEPEKCALRRLRRRRRALRRHRFADRNLQAERRRSARLSCYVDGHDVELWEGTRQVALLTRSNRLLNSGGLLQLRARRRQGRLLRNDQRSGRFCTFVSAVSRSIFKFSISDTASAAFRSRLWV